MATDNVMGREIRTEADELVDEKRLFPARS